MNLFDLNAINSSTGRLRTTLSPSERGIYSSLLSQADPISSGKVQGKQAVLFFKKSGLPVETLKKIWLIASSNGEFLDREEFYVALKLIAFAQNGIEVSDISIRKNIPVGNPKFDFNENESGMNEFNSKHTPVNVSEFDSYQKAPPKTEINSSNPQVKDFSAFDKISPKNKEMTLEKFFIGDKIVQRYESIFDKLQFSDGFVKGDDAKRWFLRSGNPENILFKIWFLVDTNNKGFLSEKEFCLGLYLLDLVKDNPLLQLPDKLPEVYQKFLKENLETSQATISQKSKSLKSNSNLSDQSSKYDLLNIEEKILTPPKNQISQPTNDFGKIKESFEKGSKEMQEEIVKLREQNSRLLQRESEETNVLLEIIDSYQILAKKLSDEKRCFEEEIKKVRDKKLAALKKLQSISFEVTLLQSENENLSKNMISESISAIEEISNVAINIAKEKHVQNTIQRKASEEIQTQNINQKKQMVNNQTIQSEDFHDAFKEIDFQIADSKKDGFKPMNESPKLFEAISTKVNFKPDESPQLFEAPSIKQVDKFQTDNEFLIKEENPELNIKLSKTFSNISKEKFGEEAKAVTILQNQKFDEAYELEEPCNNEKEEESKEENFQKEPEITFEFGFSGENEKEEPAIQMDVQESNISWNDFDKNFAKEEKEENKNSEFDKFNFLF